MANTNCLEGMQCPKCGSLEPFNIEVKAMARVYDNGTEDFREAQWDDMGYCECAECFKYGVVADFIKKED